MRKARRACHAHQATVWQAYQGNSVFDALSVQQLELGRGAVRRLLEGPRVRDWGRVIGAQVSFALGRLASLILLHDTQSQSCTAFFPSSPIPPRATSLTASRAINSELAVSALIDLPHQSQISFARAPRFHPQATTVCAGATEILEPPVPGLLRDRLELCLLCDDSYE
jgi:hypothetical protein